MNYFENTTYITCQLKTIRIRNAFNTKTVTRLMKEFTANHLNVGTVSFFRIIKITPVLKLYTYRLKEIKMFAVFGPKRVLPENFFNASIA